MKYYLNLSLLCLLFLQGCQDENSLNTLEFYWDQTGCSDPWNTSSNNSKEEVHQAVEDYLSKEGVRGAKVVSITANGTQEECFACNCRTGNRINVTVPLNQKSKMLALGFKE